MNSRAPVLFADCFLKLSGTARPDWDVDPAGKWTSRHQMSANGKRDHFSRQDLVAVADSISLSRPEKIIDEVIDAVEKWPGFAHKAGVRPEVIADIRNHHRTNL